MTREEEIIREIKSLDKKIEELKIEYNSIKNKGIIKVGDFYKERIVNQPYYKIIEIVNVNCIIAVRVTDVAVEQYFLTGACLMDSNMVKCSRQEFEDKYESTLEKINRIKPITK